MVSCAGTGCLLAQIVVQFQEVAGLNSCYVSISHFNFSKCMVFSMYLDMAYPNAFQKLFIPRKVGTTNNLGLVV